MATAKEKKHLIQLIAFSFIFSFILGIFPALIHINDNNAKFLRQLSNLFNMAGCCMLSIKTSSEEKLIAPAGFILLSIGIGTLFALQTATFNDEVYKAYAAGLIAYLPGMIMICYYDGFPVWLRVAGVVACIPRFIALIFIMTDKLNFEKYPILDGLGYLLTNIVTLGWAWYSWKSLKNKKGEQALRLP